MQAAPLKGHTFYLAIKWDLPVNNEQLDKQEGAGSWRKSGLSLQGQNETVIVERLFLCFAELLAAHPCSWLVKHQMRSEAGPKSQDFGQSRREGSDSPAPAEVESNAIKEVLTPEVLVCGGPQHGPL